MWGGKKKSILQTAQPICDRTGSCALRGPICGYIDTDDRVQAVTLMCGSGNWKRSVLASRKVVPDRDFAAEALAFARLTLSACFADCRRSIARLFLSICRGTFSRQVCVPGNPPSGEQEGRGGGADSRWTSWPWRAVWRSIRAYRDGVSAALVMLTFEEIFVVDFLIIKLKKNNEIYRRNTFSINRKNTVSTELTRSRTRVNTFHWYGEDVTDWTLLRYRYV